MIDKFCVTISMNNNIMDLQNEVLKLDNPILLPNRISMYQYYLRKASLLILLISVSSFFLSFFTGLPFLHTYTYNLSTFLLTFVTQTFERKYMFLLCNGILVFLAVRASYLPSTGLDQMEADAEPDNVINVNSMNVEERYPLYDDELLDETGAEDNGDADESVIGMDNDEEDSGIVVVGQEQNNDSETESEEPATNTEELNKKIEEFIRKMKEELKLEAQQQQIIAA